jgi:RNA-directed DNA polymerase
MKEPYIEGLATHGNPESCTSAREDAREALTGARAGTAIELRNQESRAPTSLTYTEGHAVEGANSKPTTGSAESRNWRMRGNSMHENREIPGPPPGGVGGRVGKASGRNPTMYGPGKSDRPVVLVKSRNKIGMPIADAAEGRGLTKGNAPQTTAHRTQSRASASSGLSRVREVASRDKKMRFTALLHHITVDRLKQAFLGLNRDAAPGIDGVRWEDYAAELEGNLQKLHERVQRGAYRASPSRRQYIPKADGRQRPLGIAVLEDKLLQAAVAEVMNAIYEPDFLGFSYGFRPGRGQHDALDALVVGVRRRRVNWVLDADIRGFFDTIDHGWLMRFIEHRIADRRLLRLLRKWLKAGVVVEGELERQERGTPQGATISPLLANIFLHYALDLWVNQWRRQQASGEMIIVRYADDFVVGFERQTDAQRFHAALKERLQRFSLELHPDKTRLIEFGRYAATNRAARGDGRPETFDFLGFTHVCGETRQGWFLPLRYTSRKRMRDRLRDLRAAVLKRRHLPIPAQGEWLQRVLRGYFAYHGVPGNVRRLARFRTEVQRAWRRALLRRSQRGRMTWARMAHLTKRWLPSASIVHPWPEQRFDAKTRGRSPVR